MLFWASATMALVVASLVCEHLGWRRGVWVSKPLASTGFIVAAIDQGALDSRYGVAILVALVLSWLGDVLLIPKSQASFKVGILAFLAGHLGFVAAFALRGLAPLWVGIMVPVLALAGLPVGRWIVSQAPARLRGAVIAYILVLSLMVAAAVGTHGKHEAWRLVIAAVAFYLSDLTVAVNRLVRPSPRLRALGLPLYYAAQLMFAASV